MAQFEKDRMMYDLAKLVINKKDDVAHVDLDNILFFRELETKPTALARCYYFGDMPIRFFTDKDYSIVFYWQNMFYMTLQQMALLMWHELKHIPALGNKLVKHDIQDFRDVVGLDLNWSIAGQEVLDILR